MNISEDAASLHAKQIVIDAHSDILIDVTDGHCRLGERFEPVPMSSGCVRGQVDLPRLADGGVTGQVLAVYVERQYDDDPFRRAMAMIAAFHRELVAYPDRLLLAKTASDLRQAKQEGKIGALLSLEGAEPLGMDVKRVKAFYELGVRFIGLTWNWRNAAADGWDAAPTPGGLTAFGQALVQEMGRLGIIVDIAHLAKPGFWQVLDAAGGPVIGSHCVTSGTRHALDDDQLRAVGRQGGVICAIAVKRPSLAAIVDEIEHVASVAGIDHVGIGADFFGFDLAPEGLEDATKYPQLTEALLSRGFGAGDVTKIMGGNLLRVVETVCNA